uniref:Uncharacterized protein n=1 Tax=Cannabis sativa TaxID=3483 RepID=A0A803QRZ7_CANSA
MFCPSPDQDPNPISRPSVVPFRAIVTKRIPRFKFLRSYYCLCRNSLPRCLSRDSLSSPGYCVGLGLSACVRVQVLVSSLGLGLRWVLIWDLVLFRSEPDRSRFVQSNLRSHEEVQVWVRPRSLVRIQVQHFILPLVFCPSPVFLSRSLSRSKSLFGIGPRLSPRPVSRLLHRHRSQFWLSISGLSFGSEA